MVQRAEGPPGERGELQSPVGCLVWMGWMVGASAVLLLIGILIARESPWTFTVKDALFGATLALAIVLRIADGAPPAPAGSSEPRAGPGRYAAVMLGTWGILWVVAQSLHLP